ncbi:MAG: uroporphyrinogen decarboxylase family protein [Eubacteriales bacterium]
MNTDRELCERKKRWNALLSGTAGAENIIIINYTEDLEPRSFVTDGHYEQGSDWIIKKYNIMMNNISRIHDDTIPFLDMATGTEIFAEAFGCKVIYPGNNNPFAIHKIESTSEISTLKTPYLWDTRLAELFEMAYRLRDRTDRNAVFKLPDIQSPLDIAALIMNKEEFYMGMVDDPPAIQELTYKTHTLLTQFLDEWFKEFGKEFIAHYPDYYMEYGITLSEDEIGAFGTDIFSGLVLNELNTLSDRYGRIGVHCCANSRHQWENLKKIKNLCLLNLCQPPETIKEAYGFFKDTCCQMHSFYSEGSIDTWQNKFKNGERIIFQLYASSLEDAENKLESLKQRSNYAD